MKKIKNQVLEFMTEIDTSEMNSNEFVYEMYERYFGKVINFKNGPSVESITRARRHIIKAHGIGVRVKADKEKVYIEEYCLENKF